MVALGPFLSLSPTFLAGESNSLASPEASPGRLSEPANRTQIAVCSGAGPFRGMPMGPGRATGYERQHDLGCSSIVSALPSRCVPGTTRFPMRSTCLPSLRSSSPGLETGGTSERWGSGSAGASGWDLATRARQPSPSTPARCSPSSSVHRRVWSGSHPPAHASRGRPGAIGHPECRDAKPAEVACPQPALRGRWLALYNFSPGRLLACSIQETSWSSSRSSSS